MSIILDALRRGARQANAGTQSERRADGCRAANARLRPLQPDNALQSDQTAPWSRRARHHHRHRAVGVSDLDHPDILIARVGAAKCGCATDRAAGSAETATSTTPPAQATAPQAIAPAPATPSEAPQAAATVTPPSTTPSATPTRLQVRATPAPPAAPAAAGRTVAPAHPAHANATLAPSVSDRVVVQNSSRPTAPDYAPEYSVGRLHDRRGSFQPRDDVPAAR